MKVLGRLRRKFSSSDASTGNKELGSPRSVRTSSDSLKDKFNLKFPYFRDGKRRKRANTDTIEEHEEGKTSPDGLFRGEKLDTPKSLPTAQKRRLRGFSSGSAGEWFKGLSSPFPGRKKGGFFHLKNDKRKGLANSKSTRAATLQELAKDVGEDARIASVEPNKLRLIAFYLKHRPEKLSDVDFLLCKYEAKETLMFEKLSKKYNKPVPDYDEAKLICGQHRSVLFADESASDDDDDDVNTNSEDEEETKDESDCDTSSLKNVSSKDIDSGLGIVRSIAIKSDPVAMIGILYEGCDQGVIIELSEGALSADNVEELSASLMNSEHSCYFGQLTEDMIRSTLKRLIRRCTQSKNEEDPSDPDFSPSPPDEDNLDEVKGGPIPTQSQVHAVVDSLQRKIDSKEETENDTDWLWRGRMSDSDEQSEDDDDDESKAIGKAKVQHGYRLKDDSESTVEWKKRITQLDNVVREIIVTEHLYTRDLDTINELVLEPILEKSSAGKIKLSKTGEEKLGSFFGQWKQLLSLHISFNQALQDACLSSASSVEDNDVRLIPRALEGCIKQIDRVCPFFSLYEGYCISYGDSVAAYGKELHSSKSLREFLRNECTGALRGSTLETYFIKPVQRFCRYPLLLETLTKHIPCLNEDLRETYDAVRALYERVAGIVSKVDESKVLAQRFAKMSSIHNRLRWGANEDTVSLIEPHRILIKMGTLYVRNMSENPGVNHMRVAILYNDVLLLTVARKSWLVPGLKVYDVFQALPLRGVSFSLDKEEKSQEAAFKIRLSNPTVWNYDLVLDTSKDEDQREWTSSLEEAIRHVNSASEDSALLAHLVKLTSDTSKSEYAFVRQMNRGKHRMAKATKALHHTPATVIQKTFRGFLGRRKAKKRKDELQREVRAAIVIQKAFRKMKSKACIEDQ